MNDNQTGIESLRWRVEELERRMNDIKPDALVAEVTSLRFEMRNLKRMMWALMFAIIGGSSSLTIALLTAAGTPHL